MIDTPSLTLVGLTLVIPILIGQALVYSLGLIAFSAADYGLRPDDFPDIPEELESLLARMTEEAPGDRLEYVGSPCIFLTPHSLVDVAKACKRHEGQPVLAALVQRPPRSANQSRHSTAHHSHRARDNAGQANGTTFPRSSRTTLQLPDAGSGSRASSTRGRPVSFAPSSQGSRVSHSTISPGSGRDHMSASFASPRMSAADPGSVNVL